jgi:hypothetical protein
LVVSDPLRLVEPPLEELLLEELPFQLESLRLREELDELLVDLL